MDEKRFAALDLRLSQEMMDEERFARLNLPLSQEICRDLKDEERNYEITLVN